MLERFICPDGNEVLMSECIKNKGCRLGKRCLTRSTLIELSRVRPWNGVPSTTQLLNGTYETFLRITIPYAESPDNMAFRLLGTMSHAKLEDHEVSDSIVEERLIGKDGVSGQADILETEGGWNILTDYKNSGSYKVAKALGAYPVWEDHLTDIYQKKTTITMNGEKIIRERGEPKLVKSFKFDINKQDCPEWKLQINKYRIDLEEALGINIDEMRIQAIVRDGRTAMAKSYGITRGMYLIPIPHMDNDEVTDYFKYKKHALEKALEFGYCDTKCNDLETWDGNKCKINDDGMSYCPVRKYCKFMREETNE